MRTRAGVGWSLNGLDLTGADGDGTEWTVTDCEGWDDPAGTSGGVAPNTYRDGGHLEPTFYEPPSLVLKYRILTSGREATVAAIARAKAAIPVRTLGALVYTEAGLLRHRMVKQEGKPTFKRVAEHITDVTIQLEAPDHRILSGDGTSEYTHTSSTGLPQTSGGLQVEALRAPFQITAATVSGSVTITNAGDEQPPTRLLLTNVVDPVIEASDGTVMPFSITVTAGQTLEVDLDARTVKLNGVNRRSSLRGKWIVPAGGMELKFNASTYNANARMTARWSDAWS